ncbi:hypothetical protein BCR33DRAFT_2838 [Rhizoclosmatium globosum]|uniref:HECT-type E3 ubiquitin transferase n=1 Tax=Rhizoclosmatium globosum TaxID=329046 RepID=A0A1Y2D2S4_9FUNG|nr:hypothetical protein BCR33DRAFT_2838 [Rhizoclosmatium globosum]|eukprot:ORY53560.1 hypothetical protein BCR33DRAFT_2838 [Rhizoclosmatium globosum]
MSHSRKRKSSDPQDLQIPVQPPQEIRRSSRLQSQQSSGTSTPAASSSSSSSSLSATKKQKQQITSNSSPAPKKMGRKSKAKNPLGDDDDAELMDLDVNKIKGGSPKPKKTRAKRSGAIASKQREEKEYPELEDDSDEDEDNDDGEPGEDQMQDFMAALMSAAGGGNPTGAPSSRSALFNAMFGAAGMPPPGGASSGPTATSGRFADILKQLNGKNQELQLVALQELSEELSVATEDMFMGYGGRSSRMQGFSTQEFTTTLIKLLSPSPIDDAAFAQQFMMDDDDFGGFGGGGGVMTGEVMLLACRCLSNLMEANPAATAIFVQQGGVAVMIGKLREIEYIELAETVLQVLDKVCIEQPYLIIKENGLVACLQYLDFFGLHVQRTAVGIVAKSCKGLGILVPGSEKTKDVFAKLQDILPIIENLITNADTKIMESSVSSIEAIVHWAVKDESTLESLITPSLLRAVMTALRPTAASTPMTPFSSSANNGTPTGTVPGAGNSSNAGIFTQLIRILVDICKGSTKLSVELLNPDYMVTESIYSYLTGGGISSPLTSVVGDGVLSNMVMNSIVSRGPEQVIQVLVLASELMPSVPKVGEVWCMKPVVGDNAEDGAGESRKTQPTRPKSVVASGPAPTRTLRSATSTPKMVIPQESFDTRRRNIMSSTPASQELLHQYALCLLPIMIEVFSTSVHPQIRRLSVEAIAKSVYFSSDGSTLAKTLLEARGFGKFVYELLGFRNIAFAEAIALDTNTVSTSVSVVDRERAEGLFYVSAGVQLTSLVVEKCGARVVGWLIREGILSEMRKSVDKLETLLNQEIMAEKSKNESVDGKDKGKHRFEGGDKESAVELVGRSRRSVTKAEKGKGKEGSEDSESTADGDGGRAGFLEGMKLALDRMTGAITSEKSSTSDLDTANTPQRPSVTIVGLNGEQYSGEDVKPWLLQFATTFLKNLGENKALLAAGADSSFDVLGDFKRTCGVLKKGKQVPFVAPAKDSLSNESSVIDDLMIAELERVAQHFAGVLTKTDSSSIGVTGFEVLESGVIDALTVYLTTPGVGETVLGGSAKPIHHSPLVSRLRAFLHVFLDGPKPMSSSNAASHYVAGAFKQCVTRLQECLSRVEDFHLVLGIPSLSSAISSENSFMSMFGAIINGSYNQSASAREQASPALQLSRQIRIRLIADEPDSIPPQFRNAVISIHAVATFKIFEEFMKGKVDGYASESSTSNASGFTDKVNGGDDDEAEVVLGEDEDDEEEDDEGDDNDNGDENDDEDEFDVMEEIMETEELGEGRPSSANAVDMIPPPSPTKKTSRSRSASPSKLDAVSSISKSGTASVSYAGAAASARNSFSIKFSLDGQDVESESTIFGALFLNEKAKSGDQSAAVNIWNKTYTLKFRKVAKSPVTETDSVEKNDSQLVHVEQLEDSNNVPFSLQIASNLKQESSAFKILSLLKILFALNTRWTEVYQEQEISVALVEGIATAADGAIKTQSAPTSQTTSILAPLPLSSFLNNKITAKLNRQLNEPLIVASSVLPDWCTSVTSEFSFVVPFESRVTYLQSTAFGYARSINRWKKNDSSTSSRSNPLETAMMGGRVQRQKVRVSRTRLLDSMTKVMDLYGQSAHLIEVEFFDEVGTGLGPTLEFYSSVCKELRKRDGVILAGGSSGKGGKIGLWRENGSSGDYLSPSEGLFPAPLDSEVLNTEDAKVKLNLFKSMGTFVAKALLDSRIVDMPFSTLFLDMIVGNRTIGKSSPSHLHLIKYIDVSLYTSLCDVFKFVQMKSVIESTLTLSEPEKMSRTAALTVKGVRLEDLCLDFTLPGYPSILLKPNGSEISVTSENVKEYMEAVVDMTVGSGSNIKWKHSGLDSTKFFHIKAQLFLC